MFLTNLLITLIVISFVSFSNGFVTSKVFRLSHSSKYLYKKFDNLAQIHATTIDNSVDKESKYNENSKILNNKKFLVKDFESSNLSLQYIQQSTGKVPRSYLPSLLSVNSIKNNENVIENFYDVFETALMWYLDSGGRISRLEIAVPEILSEVTSKLCSNNIKSYDKSASRNDFVQENYLVWSTNAKQMIEHCNNRLKDQNVNKFVLYDVLGRLNHEVGDLKESIDSYTKALLLEPTSTSTFRNLGAAYQASGNSQLAFASYQQALQLDPKDALVYLKLAFFYEDFASKDWIEAAENALSCYQYYVDNVDSEDTSVLTRYGNLLVREHKSVEAIAVYNKILSLDNTLSNVWFNKAHAEMKIFDYQNAKVSLEKTLELDPSISAASHMLKALNDDLAVKVESSDEIYIRDLFNSYAQIYDEHGKKLLYSAPRVIRQELAKIYKSKLGLEDNNNDEVIVSPPNQKITLTPLSTCDHSDEDEDHSNCSGQVSFMNRKLDILDLGCGTGLAGAWLKDYAKSLVGVDISDQMISIAKKKMLYEELYTNSITNFLSASNNTFDLIVAADVMSYIGDLNDVISMIPKVIRPGGHFVFTVETVTKDEVDSIPDRGYRLLRNGRFGYSKSYLDSVIRDNLNSQNYNIIMSRDFSPRLDAGNPVPGYLYIVERLV